MGYGRPWQGSGRPIVRSRRPQEADPVNLTPSQFLGTPSTAPKPRAPGWPPNRRQASTNRASRRPYAIVRMTPDPASPDRASRPSKKFDRVRRGSSRPCRRHLAASRSRPAPMRPHQDTDLIPRTAHELPAHSPHPVACAIACAGCCLPANLQRPGGMPSTHYRIARPYRAPAARHPRLAPAARRPCASENGGPCTRPPRHGKTTKLGHRGQTLSNCRIARDVARVTHTSIRAVDPRQLGSGNCAGVECPADSQRGIAAFHIQRIDHLYTY